MTESAQSAPWSYRAGPWYAVVGPRVTVLLPESERERVISLWALVDDGAGFDDVLDGLLASGLSRLPGFVLVGVEDGPTRVLLRGSGVTAAVTTADGEVGLDGGTSSTWVEQAVDGATGLRVDVPAGEGDELATADLPIVTGLVRVARIDRPAAVVAPAAAPAPVTPATVAEPSGADGAGQAEGPSDSDSNAALAGAVAGAGIGGAGVIAVDAWTGSDDEDAAELDEPAPTDESAATDAPADLDDAPAEGNPFDTAADPLSDPMPSTTDEMADDPLAEADTDLADQPTEMIDLDAGGMSSVDAPSAEPALPTGPPPTSPPPGWDLPGVDQPSTPAPTSPPPGWGPPPTDPATEAGPLDAEAMTDIAPPPAQEPPAAPAPPAASPEPPLGIGSWEPVGGFGAPAPTEPAPPAAPPSFGGAPAAGGPVARLLISDGQTIPIDRVVLIGRNPEARRFSPDEQPLLVPVPSRLHEISSTHIEVRPGSGNDAGAAVVTDMGSTNGTVLVQPGQAPEDLKPGIGIKLVPGAVINLGDGITIQVAMP